MMSFGGNSRLGRLLLSALLAIVILCGVRASTFASGAIIGGPIGTKAQLAAALKAAAKASVLPDQLVVPLQLTDTDYPDTTMNHGCFMSNLSTTPIEDRPSDATCTFGDTNAQTVLALVGDSQANSWLPTFDAMGKQDHVRIAFYSVASCQMAAIDTWNNWTLGASQGCSAFRHWALSQIAALHPKYTVVAFYTEDDHYGFDRSPIARTAYGTALVATLKTLKAASNNVLLMGRIPKQTIDPRTCVALHLTTLTACATPRQTALTAATEQQAKQAAIAARAKHLDLLQFGCTATVCPPVINNTLAYSDLYHYSLHYLTEVQKVTISELHGLGIR